ncbi:LPS export ABC transporter periplasmic protein LptC [Acidithiobacillus sulfuriphilus]|uniref:LPS export ABC transporter periplasmic protein LptC n=2 Tax=Acidithiobacillus sulfuriphilus TaxID=1867749 RepID=A0A3M8QVT3_9PROT|nr:LPS export ABC transporter periplasmic protein LptC [Acidithiobacillus sulfuriphilus]RNF60317.1 LPS export ABC transporter periplasmic protein LptC [Acidithiobacillus sulfuriphilus]
MRPLHLPSPGLLLLSLGLAAAVWFSWPKHPLPLPRIDWHGQIRRGDQAAEDVIMRQYTATGALDLLATAQTAWHDPENHETLLRGITVRRFRANGTMDLQAEHGRMDDRSRLLTLWGHVIAGMPPDTRLLTERVHYDPRTGIITTRQAVRLERGANWITGVGLWASVKAEQMNILHDVRGVYAP